MTFAASADLHDVIDLIPGEPVFRFVELAPQPFEGLEPLVCLAEQRGRRLEHEPVGPGIDHCVAFAPSSLNARTGAPVCTDTRSAVRKRVPVSLVGMEGSGMKWTFARTIKPESEINHDAAVHLGELGQPLAR